MQNKPIHKKSEYAMHKTPYHSWCTNNFAKGCMQCVKGQKLVVFVTGLCPKNCFYCPLSEQKKNHDVIYANERKLMDENDTDALMEEASASKSCGAGITGGDPLTKIDRTCRYIQLLKHEFGKKFHTHLYTILESFSEERLKKLDDAGLDELRFHPDIVDERFWNRVALLYTDENSGKDDTKRKYSFDIGIEIPVVPGYYEETKKLIEYFIGKIDFVNLNELEISDTNYFQLKNKSFHSKNQLSYGVKGSQEMALELLSYFNKKYPNANIHYCTCKLKDGVQLRERLRRRAENTRKPFDIVTHDGTLVRGAIYLDNLKPGFSYIKRLNALKNDDKEKMLEELIIAKKNIIDEYGVPENMIDIDNLKFRLITNIGIVNRISKDLKRMNLIPAIVEQYPSYDQMEVDVEFL